MAASKEIAIVEASEYAIVQSSPQKLQELIRDNVGGAITAFDLDRCKVPAGGGTMWEIPTLEGWSEEKTIDGVIVYFSDPRAYWNIDFDDSGGGTPPDCSSVDGYNGLGDPGGECVKCPLSAFGSARKGGGQACKQMRFLFVARPTSIIPLLVVAPPTSLRGLKQYFIRMAGEQVQGLVQELPAWADER